MRIEEHNVCVCVRSNRGVVYRLDDVALALCRHTAPIIGPPQL
jgi:hypothetical protein